MYRKVETGDEAGGGALSEKLQEARTMTKEYASAAVLKKLAEARHGRPWGPCARPSCRRRGLRSGAGPGSLLLGGRLPVGVFRFSVVSLART